MNPRVAVAFTTRDRPELVRRTVGPLLRAGCDVFWIDGSVTEEGQDLVRTHAALYSQVKPHYDIKGGSDIAIVYALTVMLEDPKGYDFVGLLESDVLLEPGWLPHLLDLFETPGIPVGAVTARTIADRAIFKLGDRTVMCTMGGGHALFRREAAEVALRNHRTWPARSVRHVLLTMTGVDVGAPGWALHRLGDIEDDTTCYGSADFTWDPVLALHGWATMAPLPTLARNIDPIYVDTLRYAETKATDPGDDVTRYIENLLDATCHPPSDLTTVLTETTRAWLAVPQHMPADLWRGVWTCRHECMRGLGGHVFTSTGVGDTLEFSYIGTDCAVFAAAVCDGAGVCVTLDGHVEDFPLAFNMKRIDAKRGYGRHKVSLVATGPGVEIFGAVFVEKQGWFGTAGPFNFRSLPPVSDALHRDDQWRDIQAARTG